ncbi:hypothetical protein F4808DRAFT_422662 [Astrocystis sublimbata]|nr:hypothetical protein F4808DRAFT_422662 [Astrocystis sublimbata]
MRTAFISMAALAAGVLAETTTTTSATTTTACAAESILDACLDTTESYLALCQSTDYSCLCEKYTTIMTCFANCPNDSRQYSLDSERLLYCSNASAFSSSKLTTKTTSKTSASTHSATTTDAKSSDKASKTHGSDDTATDGDTIPTATAAAGQNGPKLMAALGIAAAALL